MSVRSAIVGLGLAAAAGAPAQSLGSVAWQRHPTCNPLTVNQDGVACTLDESATGLTRAAERLP